MSSLPNPTTINHPYFSNLAIVHHSSHYESSTLDSISPSITTNQPYSLIIVNPFPPIYPPYQQPSSTKTSLIPPPSAALYLRPSPTLSQQPSYPPKYLPYPSTPATIKYLQDPSSSLYLATIINTPSPVLNLAITASPPNINLPSKKIRKINYHPKFEK